eukprot:COSAG02_NODE_8173_length_2677_cov_1.195112_2_plen_38_part_00
MGYSSDLQVTKRFVVNQWGSAQRAANVALIAEKRDKV